MSHYRQRNLQWRGNRLVADACDWIEIIPANADGKFRLRTLNGLLAGIYADRAKAMEEARSALLEILNTPKPAARARPLRSNLQPREIHR
jgi:hypothetical protein